MSAASAQVTFSEIRTGPGNQVAPGAPQNAEYIELKGPPGASLANHAIVVIGDGTSTTKSGVVEWLYRFAATDVIGSNGFLVLRNPGANPGTPPAAGGAPGDTSGPFPLTVAAGATDLAWQWQSATDTAWNTQIENANNQTFLLVTGYAGSDTFQTRAPSNGEAGQDLDTNDDGQLDLTPWASIVDSVVFKESPGSSPSGNQVWWYAPTTVGPDALRVVVPGGSPIALWTMTTSLAGTTATSHTYGPADQGANSAGSVLSGTHASTATVWNTVAGNGSQFSFSSNNWAPGDYYEISASTLGFPSVSLQWDQTRSNTGPTTFRVDMSTDGSNFTTILPSYTVLATSWSTTTYQKGSVFTIDNIPNAAGKPLVKFRLVCVTANAPAGTSRIDNVLVKFGTNSTVVSSYRAPAHAFRTPSGAWFSGLAPVTNTSARLDTPGDANPAAPTFACGAPNAGDCAVSQWNPSCSDQCCCQEVCSADPFCCQVQWDAICATAAADCTGNCGGGCQADLNSDGFIDGIDLGSLLGSWGPGVSPADFNLDGAVDGIDLGIMLGAWGPCSAG